AFRHGCRPLRYRQEPRERHQRRRFLYAAFDPCRRHRWLSASEWAHRSAGSKALKLTPCFTPPVEPHVRGFRQNPEARLYPHILDFGRQNSSPAYRRRGNPPRELGGSKVEFSRQDARGDFDEEEPI